MNTLTQSEIGIALVKYLLLENDITKEQVMGELQKIYDGLDSPPFSYDDLVMYIRDIYNKNSHLDTGFQFHPKVDYF